MLSLFILVTTLTFDSRAQENAQATLYSLDGKSKGAQFFYKLEEQILKETKQRTAIFSNSKHETIVTEISTFGLNGLQSYKMNQSQTGSEVIIEVSAKDFLVKVKKNDREKSESFQKKPNLILPLEMKDYFLKNWDLIDSGRDLDFRLLVPEIFQRISFVASKVKSTAEVLRVKVKPSVFFVAWLAPPPLFFEFRRSDRKLILFEGQTLLLGENGKPFQAKTVFE